jgi:hypothetical protein
MGQQVSQPLPTTWRVEQKAFDNEDFELNLLHGLAALIPIHILLCAAKRHSQALNAGIASGNIGPACLHECQNICTQFLEGLKMGKTLTTAEFTIMKPSRNS